MGYDPDRSYIGSRKGFSIEDEIGIEIGIEIAKRSQYDPDFDPDFDPDPDHALHCTLPAACHARLHNLSGDHDPGIGRRTL
jgi:hypothetical protein